MNVIELNKQSYNKIAGLFSQTRSYVWKDIEMLMEYVKEGDSVLDVGCGNGRLVERLIRIILHANDANPPSLKLRGTGMRMPRIKYLGIDNSENLIQEAQKKYPDQNFQVADALELKNLNQKFDVVFAISVLNHFPKEKQQEFIENVKSVLNPGGTLLMVNWNLWNFSRKKSVWRKSKLSFPQLQLRGLKNVMTIWKSGTQQAKLFYYAFTKRELKLLLTKNGFSVKLNCYSKQGKKSHWWSADNIVTVAQVMGHRIRNKK